MAVRVMGWEERPAADTPIFWLPVRCAMCGAPCFVASRCMVHKPFVSVLHLRVPPPPPFSTLLLPWPLQSSGDRVPALSCRRKVLCSFVEGPRVAEVRRFSDPPCLFGTLATAARNVVAKWCVDVYIYIYLFFRSTYVCVCVIRGGAGYSRAYDHRQGFWLPTEKLAAVDHGGTRFHVVMPSPPAPWHLERENVSNGGIVNEKKKSTCCFDCYY